MHSAQAPCLPSNKAPDWLIPRTWFIESSGRYDQYCQDLKEIPNNIPRNSTDVRILGNPLTELKANDFQHLTSCRLLSISWNNISRIEIGSFNGLISLQKLYINDNRLVDLEPGVFLRLSSLFYLSLKDNEIKQLKISTYQRSTSFGDPLYTGQKKICHTGFRFLWGKHFKPNIDPKTPNRDWGL